MINEFLAVNGTGLRDEDQDRSDWVELLNTGPDAVSLEGWHLTDDAARLDRWTFPATNLPGGGLLVVFASGKDRAVAGKPLHTDFKLEGGGEYLALVRPDGVTIEDQYAPVYPPQSQDISYGWHADRLGRGYFQVPTPGQLNGAAADGVAGPPVYSRTSCAVTGSFSLVLSSTHAGAVIRYTTDRSLPGETSAAYSTPIAVSSTLQVRARVYATNLTPGPVVTHTYVLLAADAGAFSSDLPIVIVDTIGQGEIPEDNTGTAHGGFLALYDRASDGRSRLSGSPTLFTRAAFSRRGESTLRATGEKPNLSVEAWEDGTDEPRAVAPLGLPEESDWVLQAPYDWDRAMMRNSLVFGLANQAGYYAPRTRFVEVFLNAFDRRVSYSNDYAGVYVLVEKIKRDPNRVDVKALSASDFTEPKVTGGYILKSDKLDPGLLGFMTSRGTPKPIYGDSPRFWFVDPKSNEVTAAQFAWVTNYFEAFEAKLFGGDFDPASGYLQYIDAGSFVDFWLFNLLMRNSECAFNSQFLNKDRGGKLRMGPLWDFDRTSGGNEPRSTAWNYWDNSDSWAQWNGLMTGQWGYRLFKDPDYWQRWIDRWESLREGLLSITNIAAAVESMRSELNESQARNFAKWTAMPPRISWQWEVDNLKSWMSNRVTWIDGQLVDAVRFSQPGGFVSSGTVVTVAATEGGTTYYTLDGSDPRLPGGGIRPGALTYTAPVVLASNVCLRARRYSAGWKTMYSEASSGTVITSTIPWSGLTEAVYVITPPVLAVTEVMCHPHAPSPGTVETNYSESDFEYVEIMNTGSNRAYLAGARLSAGVSIAFSQGSVAYLEPGECAVVAASQAAFRARYPDWSGRRLAGQFDGTLDNAGERITLVGPLGDTLFDFTYGSGRGWPLAADGAGHSLVPRTLADGGAALGYGGNWRASAFRDGSPGLADPEPVRDVVINEVVAHTDYSDTNHPGYDSNDWIELFNNRAQSVPLASWYLSDDVDALAKWPVPAALAIGVQSWLAFDEVSGFHSPLTNGFGLNKAGERLYLSFLPGTGEDRVADALSFEGQSNGSSLGRYPDGATEWFTLVPTWQAANHPPAGHVIISELMYHPPAVAGIPEADTAGEFVELWNPTSEDVLLMGEAGPWRLSGPAYLFPTGTVIHAGECLVVVGFDATQDATSLAAFQRLYGWTNGQARLFGPFAGRLSNGAEWIALERPLAPDLPGDPIAWEIMDELYYGDQAPWDTRADGDGFALRRRVGVRDGLVSTNWIGSAKPTPGRVNGPLEIVSPRALEDLYAPVTNFVTALVDDELATEPVTEVELLADGQLLGTCPAPAYEAPLVSLKTEGRYVLSARASTASGGSYTALPVAVNLYGPPMPHWQRRMKVEVSGYTGTTALADFPMLVRLGPQIAGFNYAQFASPQGWDLRFQDDASTRSLSYEIEDWNPAGTSTVWVCVPEVRSNTVFWASWGDAALTNRPGYTLDGSTWRNGYVEVLHFRDGMSNSAPAGLAATDFDSLPDLGVAGPGRRLTGTNSWMAPGLVSDWFTTVGSTSTVTFWTRPQLRREQRVFGAAGAAGTNNLFLGNSYNASRNAIGWNGAAGTSNLSSIGSASDAWQLLGLVVEGGSGKGTMNGVSLATLGSGGFLLTCEPLLGCVNRQGTPDAFYGGFVDEFRLSTKARSLDWIRAEYLTAAMPSAFLTCTLELGYVVDEDGDNMSDRWEMEALGGTSVPMGAATEDLDGDGALNLDEYIAGTDPSNATSRFVLRLSTTNGAPDVELDTVAAGAAAHGLRRYYSLEERGDLTGGVWGAVPGFPPVEGSNQVVRFPVPASTGSFYRGAVELR